MATFLSKIAKTYEKVNNWSCIAKHEFALEDLQEYEPLVKIVKSTYGKSMLFTLKGGVEYQYLPCDEKSIVAIGQLWPLKDVILKELKYKDDSKENIFRCIVRDDNL